MTSSFLSAYNTALMDPSYFVGNGFDEHSLNDELNTLLGEKSLGEVFEDISFQCDQLFLKCWYQNGPVRSCCDDESFAFRRFLTHNGPCFYLGGKGLAQNLPGPVGGFGFIYRHPGKHLTPTVFGSYDVNAIYLFTEPAAAIIEKNPIILPIGSRAHVSLKARKSVKKLTPISQWISDPNCRRNQSLTLFKEYSYEKCQVECMINSILEKCNCTGLNTYVNLPANRTCSPFEAMHCYRSSHMKSTCFSIIIQ